MADREAEEVSVAQALSEVREWFNRQPPAVQADIVGFVCSSMPWVGMSTSPDIDAMVASVQAWLQPTVPASSMADFGKAVCFGAIIETFFSARFEHEDWERVQAINEDLLKNVPSLKQIAANTLSALPARSAAWLDAGQSWRQLADTWLGRAGADRFFRLPR